jgi:uroporphyrinogen-III decarboxylase
MNLVGSSQEMKSKERVITALKKQKPDRVPIITFLDPYSNNWASKEKSYSSLLDAVKEYADVMFEVGELYDVGVFHSAYNIEHEISVKDGIKEIKYYTPKGLLTRSKNIARAGYTKKHLIHSEEDVEKVLSIPYKRPEINITFVKNHIQKYKDEIVPVIKLKDPMGHVGDNIDPETLAIWTLENRKTIFSLLDIALERTLDTIDYIIENNIEGIFYLSGPEYCIPPLGSPKDFKEFVVEYDKKVVSRIHEAGMYVILHSHGKVRKFLDDFIEIGTDGLDVLEPDSSMTGDINLCEVKELYGRKLCLIGNIQYDDIANGNEKTIEEIVKKTIKIAKEGGGFIIEPTADPYEVPLSKKTSDNFITYFKMSKKYSYY